MKPHDEETLLTEEEVSQMTKLSLSTLRAHRQKGKGLPYVKIGKAVRYRMSDILEYIEKHTVRHN